MKTKTIAAALAAIAISSSVALAADNTKSFDGQWLADASKLDGTAVYDFHGHKLGDLQQVLVDPQSGRIRYGIVEVDKTWSWADPNVAIPWGTFVVKKGDDKMPKLSIDATKEKLEKAPKFKVGDAERLYSKEASQPIYSYWGIYWFEESIASGKSGEKADNKGTGAGKAESSTTAKSQTDSGKSTSTNK